MKRGMVLGKFMPPHHGHVYLCDFARAYCDELAIVVEHVRDESIPSGHRFAWMRELFPTSSVVHLLDENPQDPSEHPEFWSIWEASLRRALPFTPTHVFASETYGAKLASLFGAQFVPVDPARRIVPVSGTAIRGDPLEHWRHLPECVRPYFAKRVCVFGPESTGKSTLAANLAARFETVCVPEYARTLLETKNGELVRSDLETIARGQIASEDALARRANRVLVCDTDPLATVVWSEALYGECSPEIRALAKRSYDLTLLLDVDVPWVADPVRYLPDERRSFFDRCRAALVEHGRPHVVVRGSWDERFAAATAAIESVLSTGRSTASG